MIRAFKKQKKSKIDGVATSCYQCGSDAFETLDNGQVNCTECGALIVQAQIETVDKEMVDGSFAKGIVMTRSTARTITTEQFIESRWGGGESEITGEKPVVLLPNQTLGKKSKKKQVVFEPRSLIISQKECYFRNHKEFFRRIPMSRTNYSNISPFTKPDSLPEDFRRDEFVFQVLDAYRQKLLESLLHLNLIDQEVVQCCNSLWAIYRKHIEDAQKKIDETLSSRKSAWEDTAIRKRNEYDHFFRYLKINFSESFDMHDKRQVLALVALACFFSNTGLYSSDFVHLARARQIPFYQGIDVLVGPTLVSEMSHRFATAFCGAPMDLRLDGPILLERTSMLCGILAGSSVGLSHVRHRHLSIMQRGDKYIQAARRVVERVNLLPMEKIWPYFLSLVLFLGLPCERDAISAPVTCYKPPRIDFHTEHDFSSYSFAKALTWAKLIRHILPLFVPTLSILAPPAESLLNAPLMQLYGTYFYTCNRWSPGYVPKYFYGDMEGILAILCVAVSFIGEEALDTRHLKMFPMCLQKPNPFTRLTIESMLRSDDEAEIASYLDHMDAKVLCGDDLPAKNSLSNSTGAVTTPDSFAPGHDQTISIDLGALDYKTAYDTIVDGYYGIAQGWREVLAKQAPHVPDKHLRYDSDTVKSSWHVQLLHHCAIFLGQPDTKLMCHAMVNITERLLRLRGDWSTTFAEVKDSECPSKYSTSRMQRMDFDNLKFAFDEINRIVSQSSNGNSRSNI